MKTLLSIAFFGLWLTSTSWAQDPTLYTKQPSAVQKWEYRLVNSQQEGTAVAKQAGLSEDQMVIGESNIKRFNEVRTARLNALGEEGWQFCGCLDKDNYTMVFRRPK